MEPASSRSGTERMPNIMPRVMRPRPRAGAAVALITLLGCGDALAPDDVAGVYASPALTAAPWVSPAPADGYEYQARTERLILRGDGTGVLVATRGRRAIGSEAVAETETRLPFRWELEGLRVTPWQTGCEGACALEPYLGSMQLRGATLYSGSAGAGPYRRVARTTPATP